MASSSITEKNPARQSSSLGSTEGASISEVETRLPATPIDAHEHDAEKGSKNTAYEVPEVSDLTEPEQVDWAGPDDPEKPVNWPRAKKWRITLTVSMLTFLTPFASSMFAPAIGQVMKEMGTTNRDLGSFAVSIYLLGYAFGPLFIGPCSELYGRLVVYHTCSVLFLLTNIGCALATNMPMLITFRVLTGVMGASPLTVGPGTVADLFQREERGRAMAIWTMPILIGPCIGPAVGAYLGRAEGWRWDFWLLIIMAGAFFMVSVITLRETHPPTLLRWKAKKLREAGNTIQPSSELDEPPLHLIITSVIRPLKMLFTSPIIFGLSLLTAVNYGVLYLLFTSVTEVFETRYGIVNNVGLVYFGIGAGQIAGIAVFGFVSDAMVRKLAKGGEMKPEHRLPPMIPGALMVPMGLLIYGWAAQYRVHWFVPIIGNFFIGVGVITVFAPVSTYIVDAFTAYAASATAANTVFRSMGGALLPLAGPRMYAALDQGWGNTLLAGVSILMMSMIWVVMKYGEQLRTHPKYQLKL